MEPNKPCGVRSGTRPRRGQVPDLTPRPRQRGFTLTELLISLVLGAFVVGGVLSVFVGGLETFRMTDSLSRMQENGRFALERMRRDLREAGFVGCRNTLRQEVPRREGALDPGVIRNTLNPAPSAGTDPLAYEYDFGVPLMGYDGTGDGTGTAWTAGDAVAPAPNNISMLTNPRDDSDIVVMISAQGSGLVVDAHPGTPSQPGSATIQLGSPSDLEPGDIILATDCLSGGIFQITNANFASDNLPHNTGTGTPGNFTQELGRSFVGAEVFRIERAAYYIANSPTTGRPGLFRNDEEIAENVEQLQVTYGLDITFDAQVDQYVTATEMLASGAPWDNVLAIRLNLLLSSGDEDNLTEQPASLTYNGTTFTAAADDYRLYRVFTATVGVRNRVP